MNKNEVVKFWAVMIEMYSSHADLLTEGSKVFPYEMCNKISEIGMFNHLNSVLDGVFGQNIRNSKHEREVRLFIVIEFLCNHIRDLDEGTKFEVAMCTGVDLEDHFNSILKDFKYQSLPEYIQYVYGVYD